MNSSDQWTEAWASALPVWQAAVRQLGWHPTLVAAAYAVIGLLCLAACRSARAAGEPGAAWSIAAAALLVLAVDTLFAFDLLIVELMRALARASGWYEARREVQAAVLVTVAVAALAALAGGSLLRGRLALAAPGRRWLLAGLLLLSALATLRVVSLHATDELINSRLAGLTVGRLIDALGLGLVAAGLWRERRVDRR